MRILFVGAGELGVPTLLALVKSAHEVVGVVTRPARPAGRGRKLKTQSAEKLAHESNLKVFTPEKINSKESLLALANMKPEVIVVASFGAFLSKSFVSIAQKECINVHPSLLPKYRGAAPVEGALLAGETQTGVSIMRISQELDQGDILLQEKITLKGDENSREVTHHLAGIGAKLVLNTLELIEKNELKPLPQDNAKATTVTKIKSEDAQIDWTHKAFDIHNRVRAFYGWPGTFAWMGKKKLKILKTKANIGCAAPETKPGTVLEVGPEGIRVETGEGSLMILEVQLEGGRAMDHNAFLNGHPLGKGFQFG